jgi:hypothetical protein
LGLPVPRRRPSRRSKRARPDSNGGPADSKSRTLGEDNTPKTRKSTRDLALLPDVVAVLRAVKLLHADERTFVFTTQHGTPLDEERFVEMHWRRALRATDVRPRKFYATRHTFMTWALGRGANVKWLADYCGTSLEMIERHYSARLSGDPAHLAPLADASNRQRKALAGTRNPEPKPEPSAARSKNRARPERRGGDSNACPSASDRDTRDANCRCFLGFPRQSTTRQRHVSRQKTTRNATGPVQNPVHGLRSGLGLPPCRPATEERELGGGVALEDAVAAFDHLHRGPAVLRQPLEVGAPRQQERNERVPCVV